MPGSRMTGPIASALLVVAGFAAVVALLARCAGLNDRGPWVATITYGGAYGRAVEEAVLVPFAGQTGLRVEVDGFGGGLAQIRAQVDAGRVFWDVVDVETAEAVRGCEEGLFEWVAIADMLPAPDGTSAADDFKVEQQTQCAIPGVFFSTAVAYNEDLFPGEKPGTINDFFDLEKFPGRRGMRRAPEANLEFAIMGDGVSRAEVYNVLGTEEGLQRAFDKLSSIKDHIVWWEAGAQPPQMLADREVAMSTAYNGRIFNAQVLENQPFSIVWDGQIVDQAQMAIVAGTPRLDAARRLLRFFTSTEAQAGIAGRIAYGPARLSSDALVSTHLATGVEMAPHLPTYPANLEKALQTDARWWSARRDDLHERFSTWLIR